MGAPLTKSGHGHPISEVFCSASLMGHYRFIISPDLIVLLDVDSVVVIACNFAEISGAGKHLSGWHSVVECGEAGQPGFLGAEIDRSRISSVPRLTTVSVGYEPAQDEPRGWLEPARLVSEAGSSRLNLASWA